VDGLPPEEKAVLHWALTPKQLPCWRAESNAQSKLARFSRKKVAPQFVWNGNYHEVIHDVRPPAENETGDP